MATAEIHYIVTDSTHNQADHEAILDAFGKYQEGLSYKVDHTAKIEQFGDDAVMVKLSRKVLDQKSYAAVMQLTEDMRRDVESHFKDSDKERLAKRYAGIAITGDLETE